MLHQINQNLKQMVPYYEEAAQFTCKTYANTFTSVNKITEQFQSQVGQSKKNVLRIKRDLENQILSIVQKASNQLLVRTEKLLLSEEERPSETQKKQIKKRFKRIFNKIINDYVIFYAEQAQKYNTALIKQGKHYVYANILPLYIKLKATVLVSKEILLQMLENRIDDMKMTYSVSKDTVTMLIGGKFEEDKIIQKINSGMQNFKQLTVKVVKKGLQIKVDKKSLYENYQTFSSKLLEVIRQMREKGAQKIVSARQKTAQLYQNALNRIRQKQITLKMEYKQLQDKQEVRGEGTQTSTNN